MCVVPSLPSHSRVSANRDQCRREETAWPPTPALQPVCTRQKPIFHALLKGLCHIGARQTCFLQSHTFLC